MNTAPIMPQLSLAELKKNKAAINIFKEIIQKPPKEVIKIPSGTRFLGDVMSELPLNCLFNKGRTGGGGTTIALKNNVPTVICVPFVEIIKNKIKQSKMPEYKDQYPHEVYGVFSNSEDEKQKPGETIMEWTRRDPNIRDAEKGLQKYLDSHEVPKIMVTYDSLSKLFEFIDPSDFHILIDEYHLLFTEYDYRDQAIRTLLKEYKKFRSFTFMTSTPIDEEFILEELKNIPVFEAEWEDVRKIKMSTQVCKGKATGSQGINTVMSLSIQNQLKLNPGDSKYANLYIFVNDVEFINEMIKKNGLKPENCRVILSKHNKKQLENGIVRGGTMDDKKRINFLTAAAFEGSDIYDEIGKIIIVSDGNKAHTLLDIATKIMQIAGRIRDSMYNNEITHVFSTTRYSRKTTMAKFMEKIEATEIDEKAKVETLKNIPNLKHKIEFFKDSKMHYHYMPALDDKVFGRKKEEDFEIIYDKNRKKKDLFNFKLANNLYNISINVIQAHKDCGFDTFFTPVLTLNTNNFKVTVENLFAHKTSFSESAPSYIAMKKIAFAKYPYLEEAIEKLGFDGIKKANYQTNNIQRDLFNLRNKNSPNASYNIIALALNDSGRFRDGVIISGSQIKEILKGIYYQLMVTDKPITPGKPIIIKTAKATEIMDYYHTEDIFRKIGDRTVRLYHIKTPKFNLN